MTSNFNRAEAIFSSYAESGRLPHATLVECQSSERALEFAKRLAAAALCRGEKPRPCGTCRDCVKLSHGVHPDLAVISGGEKAKSFHVDAIRDIRQDAHVKPSEADCRVFVLHNAQNMTAQAQNALLKIIEEPPNGVYFALTCENRAALLATLLSRLAVLPLECGADIAEGGESAQKAKELLDMLMAGREFDSLAALSAYERDRTGLAALLAALKAEAASRLAASVKENQAVRSEREKLLALMENAERLEAALAANVSGLLLTSVIIAGNR